MKTTIEIIEALISRLGCEIISYTEKNKIVKLQIKKYWDIYSLNDSIPDKSISEEIKNSKIVNGMLKYKFLIGKRESMCNYYNFEFSLKKEYSNGEISPSNIFGEFLIFIKNNNINNIEDFKNITVSMIYNMSKYTHTLKKFNDKKIYRNIKKNYIKFLYENKLIDSISYQTSYSGDELILFKIDDYSFHLRKEDCIFLYTTNFKTESEIYQKNEDLNCDNINLNFLDNLNVLTHVNNTQLFSNAEIKINKTR